MTVGSPGSKTKNHAGISYQCMSGGSRGQITAEMPTRACSGGIFTTHHFPAYDSIPVPSALATHR